MSLLALKLAAARKIYFFEQRDQLTVGVHKQKKSQREDDHMGLNVFLGQ